MCRILGFVMATSTVSAPFSVARSVAVGRGDEPGKLSPPHSLLRVLDTERMVDELDHVAVRVVDVGVVLAGVLAAALVRVDAADVGHGAGGRCSHVRDAQG